MEGLSNILRRLAGAEGLLECSLVGTNGRVNYSSMDAALGRTLDPGLREALFREGKRLDRQAPDALEIYQPVLAEDLRIKVRHISEAAGKLSGSAGSLSEVSERMTGSARGTSDRATSVAGTMDEMSARPVSVAAGMERVSGRLSEIAHATGEMSSTIGEIAGKSETARSITRQATREVAAGCEETQASAVDLLDLAGELRQTVARFRVGPSEGGGQPEAGPGATDRRATAPHAGLRPRPGPRSRAGTPELTGRR